MKPESPSMNVAGSAAARVGDRYTCAGGTPNGPLMPPGVGTVMIAGAPAAVVGTMCTCSMPPNGQQIVSTVVKGSATVFIGGKPAARVGDLLSNGGVIVTGCPTVLIGG